MTEPTDERCRFHVEGQTSTEGRRWQIWDNENGHYARFRNIASRDDALALCEMLNALARTTDTRADDVAKANLELAARTFRRYERLHRDKGTPEGNSKADSNAELADQMEWAASRVGDDVVVELREALLAAKPLVEAHGAHWEATDAMVRESNRVSNIIERALCGVDCLRHGADFISPGICPFCDEEQRAAPAEQETK